MIAFLDKSEGQQSSDNELKDMISDYLANKKDVIKTNELNDEFAQPASNEQMLEKITEQLNNLETAPVRNSSTPPPSPAEYKFNNDTNILNGEIVDKMKGEYPFC